MSTHCVVFEKYPKTSVFHVSKTLITMLSAKVHKKHSLVLRFTFATEFPLLNIDPGFLDDQRTAQIEFKSNVFRHELYHYSNLYAY